MGLEELAESVLDGLLPLDAFSGLVHNLSVGDKKGGHGLCIAGVVRPGKLVLQEPNRLVVCWRSLCWNRYGFSRLPALVAM